MNIWDILIVAGIALVAAIAFGRRRQRKKEGKCSCCDGSSCAGCMTNTEKNR